MNLTPDGPHLLDTSAVILMMRRRVTATSEAVAPFITFAELLAGAALARDILREREKIYKTLGSAPVIYPDLETLSVYGQVSAQLRRVGRPIPMNDLWTAALALQHGLPLLADDAHFTRVPGLRFLPVR